MKHLLAFLLLLLLSACFDDFNVDFSDKNSTECLVNEVKISIDNQTDEAWLITVNYYGCEKHITSIDASVDADGTITESISESINSDSPNILLIILKDDDGEQVTSVNKRVSQQEQLKLRIIKDNSAYKLEFN